jgi:tetratricopeptide (TPR) repeat protein
MEERIDLLMAQGKYKMAYDLSKEGLSMDPSNVQLLTVLATCALNINKLDESLEITTDLIGKQPWNAYHYYLRAHVFLQKNNNEEALNLMNQAIEIDSYNSVYFELKARILFSQNKYKEAEEAVKIALSIDAQNTSATNLLARILNYQGKRKESEILMDSVLDRDPENVESHANYGMQYLEKGKVSKAIEHFQQALFKSPTNKYAQHGMKLAMKAKFPLYRWLLQFQLFMSKQSSNVNIALIFGIIIMMRVIRTAGEKIGGIAEPIGYTIVGILVLIVLSTWILDSIMTFVLYTQKNGRLALNEKELDLAKFTGIQLLLIGIGVILGLVVDFNYLHIAGMGFLGLLTSRNFVGMGLEKGKKIAYLFYGVGSLLFLGATVLGMIGNEAASMLSTGAIFCCVIYTWVGNSWVR